MKKVGLRYKFSDLTYLDEKVALGMEALSYVFSMGDNCYYKWDSVGSENQFIRIDIEKNTVSIIKKQTFPTTIIYTSKLNQDKIFSNCAGRVIGNEFQSIAEIYDIKSNTTKRIIDLWYKESDNVGEGTLLLAACGGDNRIYGVIGCNTKEKMNYTFCEYNCDGVVQRTINADAINAIFDDSGYAFLQLNVMGDYVFVQNMSGNVTCYKITGDKLTEISLGQGDTLIPNGSNSCNCPAKYLYVYPSYYRKLYVNDNRINEKSYQALYAIETETGKIKEVKIDLDKESAYLGTVANDGKGNLMLKMIAATDDTKVREYYISSDTLTELFDSAPYIRFM